MALTAKKQQEKYYRKTFLPPTVGAGILFLFGAFNYFSATDGHDQQQKLDYKAEAMPANSSVPHQHQIYLSGLQTLEMHQKMMSSCPMDLRLQTYRTMTFPEFIDKVFDGLEKVPVSQDPLDYVASQYSKLMEERGALASGFWSEFGVWEGKTLKECYNNLKNTNFEGTIAGFDSFEGLPVHWRESFVQGTFATDFEVVRANVPEEVKLYQGWFQNTIGKFLEDYPNTPAGLINHDGDVFLSTAITFSLLNDRIVPGTLLCFDELIGYAGYQQHEILSLFIWMKEMEAMLCPIAVYNLDREHAQSNEGRDDVGAVEQSACFQVLDIPGTKYPVPFPMKEVGNIRGVST